MVPRRLLRRIGWIVTVWALIPSSGQALKRDDVPGYRFVQITDNADTDWYARVSGDGRIAWMGRWQLPGSRSGDRDYEIFVWDAQGISQLTDDDLRQDRPVVNERGDLAWQERDAAGLSQIVLELGGRLERLTADSPVVDNRYPDINDRGVVVWGRRNAEDTLWHLSVYDPLLGLPFRTYGDRFAYRPHVNDRDHIEFTDGHGVYDLDRTPLALFPRAATQGYGLYRRSELNDLDQVVIEADPAIVPSPDYQGPRDILFWDGTELRVIHKSDVWAGRPDVGNSGVLAWEGRGGLPGSRSGPNDREIFVHDLRSGVTFQLTDDDVDDAWPTVADDNTVVWWGLGGYPGSTSSRLDFEVFMAVEETAPSDADRDRVMDTLDDCPTIPNPGQEDRDADGVGDHCDSCVATPNPRADGAGAGVRTTGGQPDEDFDGLGNPCDGDHTAGGLRVDHADLARIAGETGQWVAATDCADDAGAASGGCARYDLDGSGLLISAGDLREQIALMGLGAGDLRCDACPLECGGPGCP